MRDRLMAVGAECSGWLAELPVEVYRGVDGEDARCDAGGAREWALGYSRAPARRRWSSGFWWHPPTAIGSNHNLGFAVALSPDETTAIVGGPTNNTNTGAGRISQQSANCLERSAEAQHFR